MAGFHVPLIIRGKVIEDRDVEFGGRHGGASFMTADVGKHIDDLVLPSPSALADLYEISFEEILDFLQEVGDKLTFSKNIYMQEAYDLGRGSSGLTDGILRHFFENMPKAFSKPLLREIVDRTVGIAHLEGWVASKQVNGCNAGIRAFGARTVHVIAGNLPIVAAMTVARNALIRSDAIIKTPSNDPLTAAAIARTMIDLAPDHPVTRHLSVGYWKGGDVAVEEALYTPRNVEKIVAWGGLASITHIAKYIQPGIDLITLDPKLSSTIVGKEAFDSEASMLDVAERIALDVGTRNQEACINARVIYIESGTDKAGLANINRLGQMVYDAMNGFPPHLSAPAKSFDPVLREEVDALRLGSFYHKVIGGGPEGAVIVSQIDEPVDFARLLGNRVANLVPVDSLEVPISSVTAYTQTIGIYPESLKVKIRDRLAFHGAQRLTSLGYASNAALAAPQDGIEPLRRMCKWIVEETYDPAEVPLASRVQVGV